jgi:hypothetical protein
VSSTQRDIADDLARLEAMRQTLVEVLNSISAASSAADNTYADPSPGRTLTISADSELAADIRGGLDLAVRRWASILDHARTLADAIDEQRMQSSITLARTVAEAASRSWWNLAEGFSSVEVVRRSFNDVLNDGYENWRIYTGMMDSEDMEEHEKREAETFEPILRTRLSEIAEQRANILTRAARYGIAPIPYRDESQRPHVGKARPSTMNLLGRVLESPSQGASFFQITSAVLHNGSHAMPRMFETGMDEDGTSILSPRPMNPDDLGTLLRPAMKALTMAAHALVRMAGWEGRALEVAVGRLNAAWRAEL